VSKPFRLRDLLDVPAPSSGRGLVLGGHLVLVASTSASCVRPGRLLDSIGGVCKGSWLAEMVSASMLSGPTRK
jgi:hypothetical protein